jgi:hypothetical protein
MKSVWQLETEASAPRLEIVSSAIDVAELCMFDGQEKWRIWPKDPPPEVRASRELESAYVFYSFAPGVLAVRSDVFTACEDFHWVTRDGCERLPLKAGTMWFEVIHPVVFLPGPGRDADSPPCAVDGYYAALFRIEGRPADELFCVSGVTGVPLNEFKPVYEEYGFTGLRFTEIWRGEG